MFRRKVAKLFYGKSSFSTVNKSAPLDKFGIVIFSGLSGITLCLGVWQTQRYYEKIGKIETLVNQSNDIHVSVPSKLAQDEFNEFVKSHKDNILSLSDGRFIHEREVLLGPRSAPVGKLGPGAQGMASNPQA